MMCMAVLFLNSHCSLLCLQKMGVKEQNERNLASQLSEKDEVGLLFPCVRLHAVGFVMLKY